MLTVKLLATRTTAARLRTGIGTRNLISLRVSGRAAQAIPAANVDTATPAQKTIAGSIGRRYEKYQLQSIEAMNRW
jgi:hypothetical protein